MKLGAVLMFNAFLITFAWLAVAPAVRAAGHLVQVMTVP